MTPGPGPQAGFTLIEMLVVVAILGLGLGIVAGRGPVRSAAMEMAAATSQVAGAARLARSEAVATNRTVRMTVDARARRIRVDHRPTLQLPGTIAVSASEETVGATLAAIRFYGDGSSSGGAIGLTDGQRRAQVEVDWLTGRVSVGRGQ